MIYAAALCADGTGADTRPRPCRRRFANCDDRGRTVNVHAMRHTFGTHVSKGGVSPRTAQAAMRHRKLDLTMNVYTDPRLLDVAGAMDALPLLPMDDITSYNREVATGTDACALVPTLTPTTGNLCISGANADNIDVTSSLTLGSVIEVVGDGCQSLTGHDQKPPAGLEPATCGLQNRCSTN